MTAAVSTLGLGLLGVVMMAVPGLLTARLVAPRSDSSDDDMALAGRTLVGFGWAFGMVPTFSFFICLVTTWRVSWLTLAIASAVNTIVACWFLYRRRRDTRDLLPIPRLSPRRMGWAGRALLLAVAAVGLLYLVKYDTRFSGSDSCIYAAAHVAVGNVDPHIDLLRYSVEDARLGNPGVMSAFLVAFGGPGLRVLYGILGMLLALGGYVIGRAVGGGRAFGFLGLVLLSLNPYVASIPQIDENLMSLAFGTTVLPFVVAGGGGWAAAGALFGLMVLCRHVMLPAILAMLYVAWKSVERGRAVVALLAAFVAVTFLENLHHHLALGSVFRFESNAQFPSFEYGLFGLRFAWEAMMNWPLHEELVRTPHNPFPMLVSWPLHLAGAFGLLLFTAMVAGAVAIFRVSPRMGVFWALWSFVVIGGIAVQEHWDHLNKLGVMSIVAAAFVAWIVAGVSWAARRPKIALPTLAATALAVCFTVTGLAGWYPSADERYLAMPAVSPELPQRLERDRRRALQLGLLPDFSRMAKFGSFLDSWKARSLWHGIADPHPDLEPRPWGWYPGEPPVFGPPVTIEIDLRADPFRGDFVRVTDEPATLDLTGERGLHALRLPALPWVGNRANIYAGRGNSVTAIMLYLDDEPAGYETPGEIDGRPSHWLKTIWNRRKIWSLMAGYPLERHEAAEWTHADEAVVRIAVPAGAVSIGLEKNLRGARVYQWRGLVEPGGATITGPVDLWHN